MKSQIAIKETRYGEIDISMKISFAVVRRIMRTKRGWASKGFNWRNFEDYSIYMNEEGDWILQVLSSAPEDALDHTKTLPLTDMAFWIPVSNTFRQLLK